MRLIYVAVGLSAIAIAIAVSMKVTSLSSPSLLENNTPSAQVAEPFGPSNSELSHDSLEGDSQSAQSIAPFFKPVSAEAENLLRPWADNFRSEFEGGVFEWHDYQLIEIDPAILTKVQNGEISQLQLFLTGNVNYTLENLKVNVNKGLGDGSWSFTARAIGTRSSSFVMSIFSDGQVSGMLQISGVGVYQIESTNRYPYLISYLLTGEAPTD